MSTAQSARYNPLISKLFKSRAILLTILKEARGYDTSDYEGFSVNELQSMYKNKQMDMLLTNPDTQKKLFVKYHLDAKLKSAAVYDYIDDLYDIEEILKTSDELIIVTKDRVNDSMRTLIEHIYIESRRFINVCNLNDYLFNILKTDLVPPHRVMLEEEKQKMIKKYYITNPKLQFPEISRFDPPAQAIGAKPGDLVEIVRSSPTAVTTMYYRLCH
jgi:DNA-directed RNA polymerase subunit H